MAKRILGIHIGEYRVICIEARHSGNIVVEKVACSPLPEQSVANGIISDPSAVAEVLEAVISKMEVSTNNAIVNLPANLAQIKCIPTEQDYLELTPDQLRWEISHHLNDPVEESIISYFDLPMTTVLVAAKKAPVESRARLIEKIGLTVNAIDPDPIAIFNLFALVEGTKPRRNLIIVDIQIPFTQVVVFAKGEFWYGSSIFTPSELFGIGSGKKTWREFTENIEQALNMVLNSYKLFNPAFEPDGIIFSGRPLKEGSEQSISSQIEIKSIEIKPILKRKVKLKHKKAGLSPGEAAIAVGLAAHGASNL